MKLTQTIILVEDDQDDTDLFIEAINLVTSGNATVFAVRTATEALNGLNTSLVKPDIIFSDINLPLMDGFSLAKELKSMERYRDVPVMLMSNAAHHHFLNTTENEHAENILLKPSSFNELCEMIRNTLTSALKLTGQSNFSDNHAGYIRN